jgi:hypothetical protein
VTVSCADDHRISNLRLSRLRGESTLAASWISAPLRWAGRCLDLAYRLFHEAVLPGRWTTRALAMAAIEPRRKQKADLVDARRTRPRRESVVDDNRDRRQLDHSKSLMEIRAILDRDAMDSKGLVIAAGLQDLGQPSLDASAAA